MSHLGDAAEIPCANFLSRLAVIFCCDYREFQVNTSITEAETNNASPSLYSRTAVVFDDCMSARVRSLRFGDS